MAINRNHEFEELNGIKCAIVEKSASAERVGFLKKLLELNKYTAVVAPSPPPGAASAPAPKQVSATEEIGPTLPTATPVEATPPAPETFTVGVTDVTFNPTNAIFGRLLKAPGGHVVTLAYWQQKESESHDEVPYYDKK